MATTIANKSHWSTKGFTPGKTKKITVNKELSKEEFEKFKKGVIPEQMENKWFIYCEDDFAYFHRSWTGFLIYKVKVEQNKIGDGGAVLSEGEVNDDRDQYNPSGEKEVEYLMELIKNLMF